MAMNLGSRFGRCPLSRAWELLVPRLVRVSTAEQLASLLLPCLLGEMPASTQLQGLEEMNALHSGSMFRTFKNDEMRQLSIVSNLA